MPNPIMGQPVSPAIKPRARAADLVSSESLPIEAGGHSACRLPLALAKGFRFLCARSQFFRGMKPVFVGRSVWTPSGLPQFICQGRDVSMSELGDAVLIQSPLRMLMSLVGMLQGFPGMLVSGEMLSFSLLLSRAMGMRRAVV